jgi:4'-phosphopantetheinyl transferase
MDAPARHARFCQLWTLKEACLKALGVGFAVEPAEVSFTIDAESIIGLTSRRFADPEAWSFVSLDFDTHYRVGLALRRPPASRLRLVVRATQPFGSERVVVPAVRASSIAATNWDAA